MVDLVRVADVTGGEIVGWEGGEPDPAFGFVQSQQYANYGGVGMFNEAWISAMRSDLDEDSGMLNELAIRWLQLKLTSTTTSLPSLLAEAAFDRGVSRWQEITDPTAIGT